MPFLPSSQQHQSTEGNYGNFGNDRKMVVKIVSHTLLTGFLPKVLPANVVEVRKAIAA